MVAGPACLELANTVNNWHRPDHDVLADDAETARWASAVLGHPVPRVEPAGQQALVRLRGRIRVVFGDVAAQRTPSAAALASLLTEYRLALPEATLKPTEGGYDLAWPEVTEHLAAPFAVDAFTVLRHGPLERIGECPGCGWLFLDTSKNHSRTWCSMRMCGARQKAQRHYRRTHHTLESPAS